MSAERTGPLTRRPRGSPSRRQFFHCSPRDQSHARVFPCHIWIPSGSFAPLTHTLIRRLLLSLDRFVQVTTCMFYACFLWVCVLFVPSLRPLDNSGVEGKPFNLAILGTGNVCESWITMIYSIVKPLIFICSYSVSLIQTPYIGIALQVTFFLI